ncbi:MAG: secondary thiamine-phosphate synthase enzyme YjbQ [Thermoanaerobaculia bacterium]
MHIEKQELRRRTTPGTDILDLTDDVEAFVAGTGINDGWVTVFVPGSTAGVTTLEFESGAVNDLRQAIERIAPQDIEYEHNLRWGDGNGHSHVRAALLGPSLTLPISDGRVEHGTWQQIVLCDFDNKSRDRRIRLQAMGA